MTAVWFYESGEEIKDYVGGDFILTHGEQWTSKLIRFGQGLRIDKRYAWWNHAALILNEEGDIAEALSNGVVRNHISRYTPPACYLVKINASERSQPDDGARRSGPHGLRSDRIRLAHYTEHNPDVANGKQAGIWDGRHRHMQRFRSGSSRQGWRDIR